MKKVLIIMTIMVILLSVGIVSNATVEITEEKLEETFNKIMEETENPEEIANYSFNKEKDTISIKEDESVYELKYNLEEKPKFYIDMSFEKSMTKEEVGEESTKIIMPAIGFALVGNVMGINYEDSIMYFFSKYMESAIKYDSNQNVEYTNGMEYGKEMFSNITNPMINDELFELTIDKKQETNTEYMVTAKLTVNTDKDFSILKGYAEKTGGDILENFQTELENAIEKEKNLGNNIVTDKKDNNTVANIQKIPQTGNEISLQKILYSVIAFAILLGICLAIYNKKTIK